MGRWRPWTTTGWWGACVGRTTPLSSGCGCGKGSLRSVSVDTGSYSRHIQLRTTILCLDSSLSEVFKFCLHEINVFLLDVFISREDLWSFVVSKPYSAITVIVTVPD